MAVHWVNYDLNKRGQNYTELIDYLKSHRGWARPVRNSYFVDTAMSASELRNEIKQRVDSNDVVMVVDVSGADWATLSVSKVVTEWLREHL
ncbi:hypothetical protein [Curtobacterium sp. MCBA15_013]|uniref:hypothetical protein n=1 Tax=Curtobacterium sp. MCBA15_013 TaxID=1898739 RepID=UPI0008DCBFB2|nr:hypothetical protein [Curtobacterium sp. MCBA15_013]OII18437.1 hypothetical protein BIV01_02520 [Curtobacterium sp. MCBA15_013]